MNYLCLDIYVYILVDMIPNKKLFHYAKFKTDAVIEKKD